MAATQKRKNQSADDLYVCMHDSNAKRKYILYGIKNALVMQEELEKLTLVRKEKTKTLNEIKKGMNDLNSLYQNKLKKYFPNVKNLISYTEKELNELESQVDRLKGSLVADETNAKLSEEIIEELKETKKKSSKSLNKDLLEEAKAKVPKKKTPKNLSKLDRIKNNLSVIESKLKDL